MSEKYKELLEQYDVKVLSTFRSRGTFQCETEQGLALLKEYHGSLQKLALEYEWKEKLANAGFLTTDRYFLTKEESLVTYDRYRTPFVLKHYFKGRECDCRNLSDVAASCRNLAFLHKVSSSIEEIPFENLKTESTSHLFERKNRELRSIRKFIGHVHGKNDFELLYMKCFDSFYEEASYAPGCYRVEVVKFLEPGANSVVKDESYYDYKKKKLVLRFLFHEDWCSAEDWDAYYYSAVE